jgi:Metal-dependent hydrolases of the beta-lactamase superfamily III
MFDILFLGTGASVPSKERALPCVAVRRGPDIVMFDCGEGSQRQMMISPYSFMKIRAIFVTHMHGDHFYGLPGLLQTMGMMGRRDPLTVCGPAGFSDALKTCLGICEGDLEYELDSLDVSPGDVIPVKDMTVTVFATRHGIASQGYLLREPDVRGKIDAEKAKALGIDGKDFSVIEDGGEVNGVRLEDICAPTRKGTSVAYTGDTLPV